LRRIEDIEGLGTELQAPAAVLIEHKVFEKRNVNLFGGGPK
jgi:hypothetical protein